MDVENLNYLRGPRLEPRVVFEGARRRIKAWTWYGTYPEACALVLGFFEGRGDDLLPDFQVWLCGRYGGSENVAFWHHALRLAIERADVHANQLSPEENARAVDKLFELLIEWLDESEATAD
jgi:hypothetical protein